MLVLQVGQWALLGAKPHQAGNTAPDRLELRHTQEAFRENSPLQLQNRKCFDKSTLERNVTLVMYGVSHLEHRCFNYLKYTQQCDYYIF